MKVETEVKLPLEDPQRIRQRLKKMGYRPRGPAQLDTNLLYDTTAGELERAGITVRIRQWNGHATFTLKLPRRKNKFYKVRPELETELGRSAPIERFLMRLGLVVRFAYSRQRQIFERAGEEGQICLDSTPIGWFMELEGKSAWIDRLARRLGFRRRDYVTASYPKLLRNARGG